MIPWLSIKDDLMVIYSFAKTMKRHVVFHYMLYFCYFNLDLLYCILWKKISLACDPAITVTSWWARLRLKSPDSRLSTIYSGADQRNHQSSAPLACVRGNHRWPMTSPHKWAGTRKMFPLDDVIMQQYKHARNDGGNWRMLASWVSARFSVA